MRRFRCRSQLNRILRSRITARTEHIAIAALPCPVRLLPDVVDDGDGSELTLATEPVDSGSKLSTTGVELKCAVVVA